MELLDRGMEDRFLDEIRGIATPQLGPAKIIELFGNKSAVFITLEFDAFDDGCEKVQNDVREAIKQIPGIHRVFIETHLRSVQA